LGTANEREWQEQEKTQSAACADSGHFLTAKAQRTQRGKAATKFWILVPRGAGLDFGLKKEAISKS
jgi:hypothetical protein